jgi:hypothetical protein
MLNYTSTFNKYMRVTIACNISKVQSLHQTLALQLASEGLEHGQGRFLQITSIKRQLWHW